MPPPKIYPSASPTSFRSTIMRAAASLGDIPNSVCNTTPSAFDILTSLPAVSGGTRLAVFLSSAAIFNCHLSSAKRQIRLLEAENINLRNSFRSLSGKNTALVSEIAIFRKDNGILCAQLDDLNAKNAELTQEKEKILNDLRAERIQGTVRARRVDEHQSKVLELESAVRQRDAFIHAMIDIDLHQHVLRDAHFIVKSGTSVDEAIITAIQFAACKPASPWSRILAQPDVTKSEIYKCAIELAATARLRTDKSLQVARFWKHVAKCDPRNADIITPASSTSEDMGKILKNEGRGNILDSLLDRLRAGEDIRPRNEEERRPIITRQDTSDETPNSPALVFFKFFRTGPRHVTPSCAPSHASLSSWNSDFMAPLASSKTQESLISDEVSKPTPADTHQNSLERIWGVFSTSSLASSLDRSLSSVYSSLYLNHKLRPTSSFVTGRGRSATVPFSARDLAFPPVKSVISKSPMIIAPGDKKHKSKSQTGKRVRGASLVRSKAIVTRRPRNTGASNTVSSPQKATLAVTKPIQTPMLNSHRVRHPTQNKAGLPTPPAEVDSIRYVRPPTVTRKKGSGPPFLDLPSATTPSYTRNGPNSDPVPPFLSQQRIKPYVVKNPSPCPFTVSPDQPSCSDGPRNFHSSTTSRQHLVQNDIQLKSESMTASESNKENVSPIARSPIPVTPTRPLSGCSKIPVRTPPKANSSRNGLVRQNRHLPPRPQVVKPVIPNLKLVQPLQIVKKNQIKGPLPLSALPAVPL